MALSASWAGPAIDARPVHCLDAWAVDPFPRDRLPEARARAAGPLTDFGSGEIYLQSMELAVETFSQGFEAS